MSKFTVAILEPGDRASGKGRNVYEGDDFKAAQLAATTAVADPNHIAKLVRFYNFAMFAGGMTETLVSIDKQREAQRQLAAAV